MNRFFMTIASFASIFSCSAAFSFWPEAANSSFEIGVGYRNDKLNSRVVTENSSSATYSYSGSPSAYSGTGSGSEVIENGVSHASNGPGEKFKWNNLNIWQIDANFKYLTCDDIYVRGMVDYGWINNAKFDLVQYTSSASVVLSNPTLGSNGASLYTSSGNSNKQKGQVYDANLAIGYQFRLCDDTLSLTPVIGYGWNGQHLNAKKRRGSYSSVSYANSESSGTPVATDTTTITTDTVIEAENTTDVIFVDDSTTTETTTASSGYGSYANQSGYSNGSHGNKFHTRWNGVFLGLDADYKFLCDWAVFGSYEYHWATYHAKGNMETFDSGLLANNFNQKSKNAYGQIFQIGLRWDFCDCWTASLVGEWKWYHANNGKNRSDVKGWKVEGNSDVELALYAYSPIKNVNWQSASVTLNVGMLF